ncbi:hypothetical protein [Pendulispora albinea]|uniref:Uncharacterized protein n=1 Tax=Pendulispora albinea TaxID=2741071 RepID=A0ABZ2M9I3_9BACT
MPSPIPADGDALRSHQHRPMSAIYSLLRRISTAVTASAERASRQEERSLPHRHLRRSQGLLPARFPPYR